MNPGQAKKYLKQLRQRQEQYLYYLGQLAYKAGEQGKLEDAEMNEAYRTLKGIQAQIAQWEAWLEQQRAAKAAAQRTGCPYCGASVVKGAAFCPSCGRPIATAAVPPMATPPGAAPSPMGPPAPAAPGQPVIAPPAMGVPVPPSQAVTAPPAMGSPVTPEKGRKCPRCGSALDEDALFCGNCGAKVEAALEKTQAQEKQMPAAPDAPPAPPTMTVEPDAEEAPGEGEEASASEEGIGSDMQEAPPGGASMACPGCGADVSDPEARFCPECGYKVRE